MFPKGNDDTDTAGMIRQPQSLAFVIVIFLSTDNRQAGMALITFSACYKQHATMNNLAILVNSLPMLQTAFLLLGKATFSICYSVLLIHMLGHLFSGI